MQKSYRLHPATTICANLAVLFVSAPFLLQFCNHNSLTQLLTMANLTIKQKKEWARMLYLDGTTLYTQAEISEKVGISRITLGRWIKDEKWAELRVSVTMTREQSIKRLYRQIDEVLGVIERRPCGERYPSSQESDTIKKITASIKPNTLLKIEPDAEVLLEAQGFARRVGPKIKIDTQYLETIKEAIL